MTEERPDSEPVLETAAASDASSDPPGPPKAPKWFLALAIFALVLFVGIIVLFIAGGGEHGPGRHLRQDDAPTHNPGLHTPSP